MSMARSYVTPSFCPSWFIWPPLTACYEANLKSSGDKQPPCLGPFSVGHGVCWISVAIYSRCRL